MRTMMRAVLLSIALLLPVSTDAAPQCLSRSEARALWPRTYLHWRTIDGRRCWAARGRRVPAAAPMASPDASPVPRLYVPAELVPHIEPPPAAAAPELDGPWKTIQELRAEATDAVPFSTFPPGGEPDVWPPCCATEQPVGPISTTIAISLAVILAAGGIWYALEKLMRGHHGTPAALS
jgi:hypothetical protein